MTIATRAHNGALWAEIPGRKERDDANGGSRIRLFEGRYSTSGNAPGSNGGVTVQPLPTRGFGYPGSSNGYKLDTIDRNQMPNSSDKWNATLTYLPPTTGSWSTSGAAFSILPRSWSISGELLQFADSGDYYYVNDPGANDPILGEVPAFKKLATGRLIIQEVVPDIAAARTRAKLGLNTKNLAVFESAAAGDMLYLGFESEEFVNADGDVVWRLRHQFLERDIPGKAGEGWEYVLRDDNAQWAFIQISPAANDALPIYPSSNYSAIFAAS
jgi:hypothetical protein